MTLTRWDRSGLDWPERWRRWFDLDLEPEGWLRVEEVHEDGTLVVRAELPGVDPDKDVEVSVSEGMLHISAKREERTKEEGKSRYRSEFRYGAFSRDLALPSDVDKDAIKADYKDGILEVRVPWPKEVEAKSAKVPISRP
jgi:HSP20 family protein